jgi:predicted RND superfamily exporter protein
LERRNSWKTAAVNILAERALLVVGAVLICTFLLLYPMFQMAPSLQASPNPPGEVFDLQKDLSDKFPNSIHFTPFLLESRTGDVLTPGVLLEFKQRMQDLSAKDMRGELAAGELERQPYLTSYLDPDIGILMAGAHSILGPIEDELAALGTTIENASVEEVKQAVHILISDAKTKGVLDFLSRHSTYAPKTVMGNEITWWTSPAMTFSVMTDNEKLGGGGMEIGVGGGPDVIAKEHLNRRIRDVMAKGSGSYDIWGIAIDANLEAQDEGKTAGIFIMFTVIGALLVVGLTLKSYWATAICGIGLGVLMIWLKGISGLIGLKSGLVIDLIVPISMISLGVDFAVHALRRYKEELSNHHSPRIALKVGLSSVLGALILAMATDSIAFLSNLSSQIEAVIHFGSAAAIAVLSSFLILGVVAPIILMRIDELFITSGIRYKGNIYSIFRLASTLAVAITAGVAIILMIAVSKLIGVLILCITALFFIGIPIVYIALKAKSLHVSKTISSNQVHSTSDLILMPHIETLVTSAATHAKLVLTIAALLTAISVFFALKLEPIFDVKDFFDSRSEMVIGLDKLDEHVGDNGGEPGVVYIRGDLMDPLAVISISKFIESLREIDYIAETPSGSVTAGLNLVNISKLITASPATIAAITSETGISITDLDRNGVPDSREQMETALRFSIKHGFIGPDGTMMLTPGQIRQAIYLSDDGEHITGIWFQIPGTRNQAIVTATEQSLQPYLQNLEGHELISKVGLTGSPFTRKAQLSASTRTLYTSLPIALIAAVILLTVSMRSIKYAVITVIPILLVVVWLYGIMYVSGFSLNFVTAMIGAISIGIGIDYSIHMTERFREELKHTNNTIDAIKITASGTGVALVASATSSIVGFAILGFAPMPMFAAYGQLTAVMIFLALIASLIVLPCLLLVVTKAPSINRSNRSRTDTS